MEPDTGASPFGFSYRGAEMYATASADAAAPTSGYKPINTGGGSMEWLGIVGALAPAVAGIADAVTGTGKAKAEAAEAAANAQAEAIRAQVEHDRLAAQTNRTTMTYALLGVGVVVVGALAYKLVA